MRRKIKMNKPPLYKSLMLTDAESAAFTKKYIWYPKCMKCRKVFKSPSRFIRTCPKCAEDNIKVGKREGEVGTAGRPARKAAPKQY